MSNRNLTLIPSDRVILDNGMNAVLTLEYQIANSILIHRSIRSGLKVGKNMYGEKCDVITGSSSNALFQQAAGLASTGQRVSLIVNEEPSFLKQPLSIEEAPFPLLIYRLYDRAAESTVNPDFIHFVASSPHQLLDLALKARKVSELTLNPVVLSLSARTIAPIPHRYTFPENIDQYLPAASASISAPTKIQRIFFGEKRTCIPNWFDWNRSVASGLKLPKGLPFMRAASKTLFQDQSRTAVIDRVFEDPSSPKLEQLETHKVEDARFVLVTEGPSTEMAKAIVDHLRAKEGVQLGCIGITQMNPFPLQELGALIGGMKRIGLFGLPFKRFSFPRATSFYSRNDSFDAMMTAARLLINGKKLPEQLWLDCECPDHAQYPKREILLGKLKSEFPEMEKVLVTTGQSAAIQPEDANTFAFAGFHLDDETIRSIASVMKSSHISGSLHAQTNGCNLVRLTTSKTPLCIPGTGFKVDRYFAALNGAFCTFAEQCAPSGEVFFASNLSADEFVQTLAPGWDKAVKEKALKIYLFKGKSSDFIPYITAILNGDLKHDKLEDISERVAATSNTVSEAHIPAIVAETTQGDSYSNLAGFYGRTLQAQLQSNALHLADSFTTPEPALLYNTVPPYTAALAQRKSGSGFIPEVIFQSDAPIGKPWLICPEGAIGSLSLSLDVILNNASAMALNFMSKGKTVADKIKRSHKHLSGRILGELLKSEQRVMDSKLLEESIKWFIKKLRVSDADLPAYQDALNCTKDVLLKLPIHFDSRFLDDLEKNKKGSGELLLTFVNPDTCKGCGLCDAATPDACFEMKARTSERVLQYRDLWTTYEAMPDTKGNTIAGLETSLGKLGSISLSKYINHTMMGSGLTEAGSGVRLALKMITSMAESCNQKKLLQRVDNLKTIEKNIKAKVAKLIGGAIPDKDLPSIEQSLTNAEGNRIAIADLLQKLSQQGQKAAVDVDNLRGYAEIGNEIANHIEALSKGNMGLGQARFGLVITSETLKNQIPFPLNPFQVPTTLTQPERVLGYTFGFVEQYLKELSRTKTIERATKSGPKTGMATHCLCWEELSDDERKLCPPVIAICSRSDLQQSGLLEQAIDAKLPLKIMLLDEMDSTDCAYDPVLNALMNSRIFVASCALHEDNYLGDMLQTALETPEPALIHFYTPSLQNEGQSSDQLLNRSEKAVQCQVHPLFHTDMTDQGVLGSRLVLKDIKRDVDKNATPVHWAFGHAALKHHFTEIEATKGYTPIANWLSKPKPGVPCCFTDSRRKNYALSSEMRDFAQHAILKSNKLLELAGEVSPFTEGIRASLEEEFRKDYEKKAETLKQEHAKALEEARLEEKRKLEAKVTDQLLNLTGYGAKK
ncbi:MAG: hypothetical protein CR997_06075 [Acidobacteria bacterium]|nr:MAG: hypothetical protein CR997_06075 [Acidobacteriota bacterium]